MRRSPFGEWALGVVVGPDHDDDVTGPSDPLEHLCVVELELALADLETVEKRLHDVERRSKLDKTLCDDIAALRIANDALSAGWPLYRAGLKAEHSEFLASYSCSPTGVCSPW